MTLDDYITGRYDSEAPFNRKDQEEIANFESVLNTLSESEKEIIYWHIYDIENKSKEINSGLKHRVLESIKILLEMKNVSEATDNTFFKLKTNQIINILKF